jgi:catechol 2,3-dioxygenase-like lactoylglutathione lyase family enzyme
MLKAAYPGLFVKDMRKALEFYEGKLGFQCTFKVDDELHPEIPYAIVKRDDVALHLSLDRGQGLAGKGFCYIDVDVIDGLAEEWKAAEVTFVRALEDSRYGMRDFVAADHDGNHLGFGQRRS